MSLRKFLLNAPAVAALLFAGVLLAGRLMGYTAHPILSGSMEPAIMTGSLAVVEVVPMTEIRTGDVVAFHDTTTGIDIAHRVLSVGKVNGGYELRTKGDNNPAPDPHPYKTAYQEISRVAGSVPKAGYAVQYFRTGNGRMLAAGALLAALAIALWPSSRKRGVAVQGGSDARA